MKFLHLLFITSVLALASCALPRSLDQAILTSDEAAVRQALSAGDNPSEVREDWVPLVKAVSLGNERIVEQLLSHNVNLYGAQQLWATQYPAFVQYRSRVSGERYGGGYPAIETSYDALCAAARSSNPKILSLLLEYGFDVNKAIPNPVLCALQGEKPLASLKILLEVGVDLQKLKHESLMHRAVTNEYQPAELVEFLLQQGLSVSEPLHKSIFDLTEGWEVSQGQSPLVTAIVRTASIDDHYKLIKVLLDHGADPQERVEGISNVLLLAMKSNCLPCTLQLITAGAHVDSQTWNSVSLQKKVVTLYEVDNDLFDLAVDAYLLDGQDFKNGSELMVAINLVRTRDDLSPIFLKPRNFKKFKAQQLRYSAILPGDAGEDIKRQQLAEQEEQLAAKEMAAQRQKYVDQAIKERWEQSIEFDQLLTALGSARSRCENHKKLYRAVSNQKCSYLNKYKNWSTSDVCEALKKDMKKSIKKTSKQSCKNYGDAKSKVISIFDSQLEKNSVNNEIYARANRDHGSYQQLVNDYDDPVSKLESLVESSRRSERKANTEREREAWNRVLQAASNFDVQSPVSNQFKRNYESINQILISQAALNAPDSQINQQVRKTKTHLEENPIKIPNIGTASGANGKGAGDVVRAAQPSNDSVNASSRHDRLYADTLAGGCRQGSKAISVEYRYPYYSKSDTLERIQKAQSNSLQMKAAKEGDQYCRSIGSSGSQNTAVLVKPHEVKPDCSSKQSANDRVEWKCSATYEITCNCNSKPGSGSSTR